MTMTRAITGLSEALTEGEDLHENHNEIIVAEALTEGEDLHDNHNEIVVEG